jgi:hypothetical protein
MSTKTTFKRVALVVVATLGFGVLTSVAPASAAGNQELATSIAVGTVGTYRSGTFSTTPIVINMPSSAADTDTVVVSVRLTSCPTTSTYCSVSANPTQSAYNGVANNSTNHLTWAMPSSGSGSNGTANFNSTQNWSTSGNATATAQYVIGTLDSPGQITLNVSFKPDVSGTYTFLVSTPNALADTLAVPAANTNYYSATANDTSVSFSVTTKSAATAATLAAVTSGGASGSSEYGNIYKLTLQDSAGAATLLGSNETITLSSSDSSVTFANVADTPGTTATTMTVKKII